MAFSLKGAPVAEEICGRIREQCAVLNDAGIVPGLAIVRVGERPSDISYERGATKRAAGLGVEVFTYHLPETITRQELINTLQQINEDSRVHGCLMFRPLPAHLDAPEVYEALEPRKDVDSMTASSMSSLLVPTALGFAPCTADASLEILRYYHVPLKGKRITVVGKSQTVGLPTALLMMNEDATVSVCHIFSDPEDTRKLCSDADIIISATGCMGLIKRNYAREGQVIVDVGVSMGADGKLHGDVDFENVEPMVAALTPVPGGVGAVTSTVLVSHVVEAALKTLHAQ